MDRTRYPSTIRAPDHSMLKPGVNNKKLGGRVTVGPLRNAVLYSLSLEERRTCPTACLMWDKCYGNNMPFAHRYDHTSPDFLAKLSAGVAELCDSYKRVLIRLHVLGDFYSIDYVRFWGDSLERHPELHLFGYTAHAPDSDIGRTLHQISTAWGWHRCAIRFSGWGGSRGAVVGRPDVGFTCPEQTGKVKSCAQCGACWNGEDPVNFKEH
ncbi:MAG: hypothetical protein ACK5MY_02625 [Jhaorihella sp.]